MKVVVSLVALMFISGCATTEKYKLAHSFGESELATLYVYRSKPFFHTLRPEKPFIYLNGKVIARLGTGQSEVVRIPAGKYRLSVRQPILFLPGAETDTLEQAFEAGKEYYLRYSMKFGGAIPVGSSISVVESSDFDLVDAESYQARR